MRAFVVSVSLLAGVIGFGESAQARDQFPPPVGSVCDVAINAYEKTISALQVGVVRISSNVERDGTIHFGFYGEWTATSQNAAGDLPPLRGKPKDLEIVQRWGKDNGMWLVLSSGYDGQARMAQIFVHGRKGRKPWCVPLYTQAVSYDPANAPRDIFQ